MSTAPRLDNFLRLSQTDYRTVDHRHTESAADSAHAAHLSTARVAKSVLLRDKRNGRYLVALTPACNRVHLGWVRDNTHTDAVLAREAELVEVFPDCELGAVPGFGQAYQLDMVWDEDLGQQPSVFFEAGDHQGLIEIERDDFHRLFDSFPHGVISQPSDDYLAYHSYEFWGEPG
ncbi:YbaK/EbsC family protein [Halioglobus maricola]|uniref:YbaK/EbsC family protein n=1 Tax=Halioglobus maricola TaxID=2601894 RepID=A0A5P9NKH1_9GAMM|nr:YbaK/EbsC family protein [Halioglobus maricola]QFU75458.1 YbaK/EbsC family protein [Halioglobus maricola]